MKALNDTLKAHVWKHPGSYAGHNPEGDVVLATRHRDSDTLTRSNWQVIRKRLAGQGDEVQIDFDEERPTQVYDFRAGHPMVGWVEYLIVPACASDKVLAIATDILDELEGYPILDEGHFSELESEEAADHWRTLSVRERGEYLARYEPGCSLFAARRDYIPSDTTGSLEQVLVN